MRRQHRGTHRYAQVWHVHRPSQGLLSSDGMFAASEMVAGGDVDFEAMKVVQLKGQGGACGARLDADGAEGGAAAAAACTDCVNCAGGARAPGE